MAHGISLGAGGRAIPRGPKRLLSLRADDHLVERLRRGDEAAFEVIYERHVPGVLSFCRHMLGSREEAEDAVQHAFTSAHRALLRDEREIHFKPWLYSIARNRCLSVLRARREHAEEDIEPTTAGLDAEVEQRDDLRHLVADLHDLPEDQRAALVLSELRDLSHAEVADVLGCRVANVKGLVFRARAGLSERRLARESPCEDIRQELATARGGALRRGGLRHHLRACTGCSAYLDEVRHQRKMMAAVLPVIPTAGLKSGVLAAVGIGGGTAAGGGGAAGGGLLAGLLPAGGATVAKVAVIGAVAAGGGGVIGKAALDDTTSPPSAAPVLPRGPAAVQGESPLGGVGPAEAAPQERAGSDPREGGRKKSGKGGGKAERRDERSRPGRSERAPAADRGRLKARRQPERRRARGEVLTPRKGLRGVVPTRPRAVTPIRPEARPVVPPERRIGKTLTLPEVVPED